MIIKNAVAIHCVYFYFHFAVDFPTAEVHYVEAPSDHTIYPNGTT